MNQSRIINRGESQSQLQVASLQNKQGNNKFPLASMSIGTNGQVHPVEILPSSNASSSFITPPDVMK